MPKRIISPIVQSLERVCKNPKGNPKCHGKMVYKTAHGRRRAEKLDSVCNSCRAFGVDFSLSRLRNMSLSHKGKCVGALNHFYGKKHTAESRARIGAASKGRLFSEESRKRMSEKRKGRKHSNEAVEKMKLMANRPELRSRFSKMFKGSGNPFFGKTHTKQARQKMAAAHKGRVTSYESRRKMSIAHRGEKNAMFGRPCSGLVGRGVSGSFRGVLFRSSCELLFLMKHPETTWKSAERKMLAVPYVNRAGTNRRYFADFVGNGYLVEIKPLGWHRNPSQSDFHNKQKAAAMFCKENGLEYIVVEMPCLPKRKIFEMRAAGVVKLNSRWERQFLSWKGR